VIRSLLICSVLTSCALQIAFAQEARIPEGLVAGTEPSIATTGSGHATFYLVGPGVAIKNEINLGEEIRVRFENLKYAGQYLAILCADTCRSTPFTVNPAQPANVTLLVHPSRVPVGAPDAVSGVAIPFDRFGNLVLAPQAVNFQATGSKGSLFSRPVPTREGVAWFRTESGKSSGLVNVTATVGEFTTRRVLQQVAAEPCNLRIRGERTPKGILIETEPVHDCMGNPVSDGTIVTFTAMGSGERSTVDAPVKHGVASARILDPGPVTVSVASGVAMGNEVRIEGARQ
jgi:hypothetical protein